MPRRIHAAAALLLTIAWGCSSSQDVSPLAPSPARAPRLMTSADSAAYLASGAAGSSPTLSAEAAVAIMIHAGESATVTVTSASTSRCETIGVSGAIQDGDIFPLGIGGCGGTESDNVGQVVTIGPAAADGTLSFSISSSPSSVARVGGSFPDYTVNLDDGLFDFDFDDVVLAVHVQASGPLSVRCTPNPVTRGAATTCTATPDPTEEPPSRFDWRFVSPGGTVKEQRTSDQWSGIIVTSGKVQVSARVGGQERKAETELQVQARTWTDPTPRVTEQTCAGLSASCPLRNPPRQFEDLGQGQILPPTLSQELRARVQEVSGGPNDGWWFLAGASAPVRFDEYRVSLNSILFEPSDRFWTTRTTCTRGQVPLVLQVVREHENVHVRRFLRLLPVTQVNQIAEDATAFGSRPRLLALVDRRARSIADTIDWMDDRRHVNEVYPSLPCDLHLAVNR